MRETQEEMNAKSKLTCRGKAVMVLKEREKIQTFGFLLGAGLNK
jgi:hypothetical protein